MSEHKIKVGITLGDVNGIGTEVVIKALIDNRICELCTPVIYGPAKAITFYKKTIADSENFQYTAISSAREVRAKRINLINCADESLKIEPGTATKETGEAAVIALKSAVTDLKAGLIDVLVTAPINKESVQSEAFKHTGHTEFLAAEFGAEALMMMCSELLKVGLVTIHIPVSEVTPSITKEKIVNRLVQLRKSLIADFSIVEPRIAVMSLNPHAGDGGLLGEQEQTIIKPAILDAAKLKVLAFGPFAADGLFAGGSYKKYDAVLAMYHDQGLTPFKALSPQGVNYSAGLSVVRTSPDHGVAYDIAGKDKADPSSMREAIYAAIDIYRSRVEYALMTRNPLRHFERDRGADMSVKDLPEQNED